MSGLATLTIGLTMMAFTPAVPPPFYSQASLQAELSGERTLPGETPPTQGVAAEIPDDSNTGWSGLIVCFWTVSRASRRSRGSS